MAGRFASHAVEGMVENSTRVWQRWFDTNVGLENAKSHLMGEFRDALKTEFGGRIANPFFVKLKERSEGLGETIEQAIAEALERKEAGILDLEAKGTSIQQKIERAKEDLRALRDRRQQLEAWRAETGFLRG